MCHFTIPLWSPETRTREQPSKYSAVSATPLNEKSFSLCIRKTNWINKTKKNYPLSNKRLLIPWRETWRHTSSSYGRHWQYTVDTIMKIIKRNSVLTNSGISMQKFLHCYLTIMQLQMPCKELPVALLIEWG